MNGKSAPILVVGLILLSFGSRCLAVETLEVKWSRVWGGSNDDWSHDVVIDTGGNLYVVGNTESFGATRSSFLVKYSPGGRLLWEKTWRGAGHTWASAVAVDRKGNTYMTGTTFLPGASRSKIFLVKYDPEGVLLWEETWGSCEENQGLSITTDAHDNVYMTVSCRYRTFLGKYTTKGELIWQEAWGREEHDTAEAILVDDAGYVFAAGRTWPRISSTEGSDVLLAKYTSDGEFLWDRTWGGDYKDGAVSAAMDTVGNVYLAGTTRSFDAGSNDGFLLKYSPDGELLWERTWGGHGYDGATSVAIDPFDGIYVTGWNTSLGVDIDAYLVKYTSDGELVWQKALAGSQYGGSEGVVTNTLGNVYMTGATTSLDSGIDSFLIRVSTLVAPTRDLVPDDVVKHTFLDETEDMTILFLPTAFAKDKQRIIEERLFGLGRKTLYHPEVRKEHYKEVVKELITQPLTEDHRSLLKKIAEEEIKRLDLGVDEASTFLDLVDLSVDFATLGINQSFITENIASSRFLENVQAIVKKGKEVGENKSFQRACQALQVALADLKGTLTLIDLTKATLIPSSLLQEKAKERLQDIERSLIETESFLLADPAFIRAVDEIKEEMQALDYGWYTKALVAIEEQKEEILSSSVPLAVVLAHLPHAWAFTLTWDTIKGIASQEDELYQACIAATIHKALYPSASFSFSLAQLDYYSQLSFYSHMVRLLTQPVAQLRYLFSKTAREWQEYYEKRMDVVRENMRTLGVSEIAEQKVFFVGFYDDPPGSAFLYMMNFDGTGIERVISIYSVSDFTSRLELVSVSPGNELLFEKNGHIYKMDLDTRNITRLSEGDYRFFGPLWSPDGTKILFYSDIDIRESDYFEAYVMNADGTEIKRVTRNNTLEHYTRWTSDGKGIIFNLHDGRGPSIHSVDLESRVSIKLTDEKNYAFVAAVSPDNRIAFLSRGKDSEDPYRLYAMNADGTDKRPLGEISNMMVSWALEGFLSWSLEGTSIAFVGKDDSLYISDGNGNNPRKISETITGPPIWTPRGLIFSSIVDGDSEISIVDDKLNIRRLTDNDVDDFFLLATPSIVKQLMQPEEIEHNRDEPLDSINQ